MVRSCITLGFLGRAAGAFTFASVGDWGGATLGGYHQTNEIAVAAQMGKTASELDVQLIVNTGDNFYYCGVENLSDAQFKTDFEDVFTDKSLHVPWYGLLGNHDYAYDVQAQLKYKSPNNDRWQIPDRNYTKRVHLGGSNYATFVFVDTNPCIASYRADDPKGWDPCSGDYGECKDTPDKECHFHDHILAQDCQGQYDWLKSSLDAIDKDDWIIAVGHHEADKIDVKDFTELFLARKINLYLNGHTHALKHYQIDGNKGIDWFTSGAGCMIHTHDQDQVVNSAAAHSVEELFYQAVSGFTVHTFSKDFTTLTTKVIDTSGNVIYSFVTAKSGSAPPGPAPGPVPPPSPPGPSPSGASCKSYGCGRYEKKHTCQCSKSCKTYKDCCDDYDKVCGGDEAGVVV
jgi:predicted MPP superfamily phosphohydrolase